MPTLRSEVMVTGLLMVKAILTKIPALVPTKVRRRETKGKESFFNEAKAGDFELFSHASPRQNIHATREVKSSAEDWNILKITLDAIALFTVTFSHLHYNVFERGCGAISGRNYKIARNCLTSTFKNIVMQMRKGNCEKGYFYRIRLVWGIYSLTS